jgi:hypothetical protein
MWEGRGYYPIKGAEVRTILPNVGTNFTAGESRSYRPVDWATDRETAGIPSFLLGEKPCDLASLAAALRCSSALRVSVRRARADLAGIEYLSQTHARPPGCAWRKRFAKLFWRLRASYSSKVITSRTVPRSAAGLRLRRSALRARRSARVKG